VSSDATRLATSDKDLLASASRRLDVGPGALMRRYYG
jgi:hypothetical protein